MAQSLLKQELNTIEMLELFGLNPKRRGGRLNTNKEKQLNRSNITTYYNLAKSNL